MSGLEGAASIAGLVSLSLTLFQSCMQAFQIAEAAFHLGVDADIIQGKLEWEQYRLYQWAEQVGLENEFNGRLNWAIAANILKRMEALLTSSKEWKKRYHLDVPSAVGKDDSASERQEFTSSAEPSPARRTGFGAILATLKPHYTSTNSRIIQESNAPLKRIEWALVGKDRLNRLLSDINYFNNCLHDLLEFADRSFVTAALGTLLRDIISRSDESSELDVIKELVRTTSIASPEAVASAASLKKLRLILRLGKNADAGHKSRAFFGPKPTVTYLKSKHLVREFPHAHPYGREIARYKSDLVLIEWKFIKRNYESKMKDRVNQLAILLGNARDTLFHSLLCLGMLPKDSAYQADEEDEICYGLVFSLALPQMTALPSSKPKILTLADLYMKSRRPSLSDRLIIAQTLAESLLQLHTTGWLHKGIRPKNIIFLDVTGNDWESRSAKGPFLGGYEYSRPSNADTETVRFQPDLELYRHPSAQGPVRSNFSKAFDLFALGCVLLEIALWKDLGEILKSLIAQDRNINVRENQQPIDVSGNSEWNRIMAGKDYLLVQDQGKDPADVAFYAGDTFWEVILLCLHAPTDNPDDGDLEVQKLIVDKLKDCRY
ncbi:hypothetical protein ACLMJK_003211 [Lecanora helva]